MDWTGLDGWTGWMDPAEKLSPLRAPAVLKIPKTNDKKNVDHNFH